MNILKTIHQIWFGDKNKMPWQHMSKWKIVNPTWEYVLWTEETVKTRLPNLENQKHFDSLIFLHEELKKTGYFIPETRYLAGQADIVRYEILYNFGGFFIDADTIPLVPLIDSFCLNDSFSVYENEIVQPGLIANGYIGACKNNLLMRYLIDELKNKETVLNSEPCITTGPFFMTDVINKYKYTDIKIYPSYYFIPTHHTGLKYKGTDTANVYCEQLWSSTKLMY